ncbi:hypothetical protein ACH5RR_034273 [Cinchona calisaya]|uniref:Uncharacterized protein n=1 Tax=Cinchona calisaya TaxID=153742 RepID=A0ABD2YAE3_9GENT
MLQQFIMRIRSVEFAEKKTLFLMEFLNDHAFDIQDFVILCMPFDDVRRIVLDKKIIAHVVTYWLHGLWDKFLYHYKIDAEYLLLFKYKGQAEFDVCIFNPVGVEALYPLSGVGGSVTEKVKKGAVQLRNVSQIGWSRVSALNKQTRSCDSFNSDGYIGVNIYPFEVFSSCLRDIACGAACVSAPVVCIISATL